MPLSKTVQARRKADAAWGRYASACRLGGSASEQRTAFERALKAEEAAWRLELRPQPKVRASEMASVGE
jgi:hypothetical protein